MNITEREKVLCEQRPEIIATIRFYYVDNVMRQLLQRKVAVRPELCDSDLRPLLAHCADDCHDLGMY